MKQSALYLLGPIITALGMYLRYRKKDVGKWLSVRRIDQGEKKEDICRECGAEMRIRVNQTGPRAGMKALVCSKYPTCRNVIWKNG